MPCSLLEIVTTLYDFPFQFARKKFRYNGLDRILSLMRECDRVGERTAADLRHSRRPIRSGFGRIAVSPGNGWGYRGQWGVAAVPKGFGAASSGTVPVPITWVI